MVIKGWWCAGGTEVGIGWRAQSQIDFFRTQHCTDHTHTHTRPHTDTRLCRAMTMHKLFGDMKLVRLVCKGTSGALPAVP